MIQILGRESLLPQTFSCSGMQSIYRKEMWQCNKGETPGHPRAAGEPKLVQSWWLRHKWLSVRWQHEMDGLSG